MSTVLKRALMEEYALVARALAAPARLAILEQLAQCERGVDGLSARTGLGIANCSQHLQTLRRAGLVSCRRKGKAVIYRLADTRALGLMAGLGELAARNLEEVEHLLRGLAGGAELPVPVGRAELQDMLAQCTVVVLDVRPADEFAAGHIPGARRVEPGGAAQIAARLDPAAEIVAYCRGPFCIYAHQAVAELRRRGLSARTMRGGLPEWAAEGRPLSGAPAPPGGVPAQ